MRSDLPAGTVTFLFTDIEGSTRLLGELGVDSYAGALAEHRRALDRRVIVFTAAELAAIAAGRGDSGRAGLLWGAVEAEVSARRVGQWEQNAAALEGVVRRADGPVFQHARDEGRLLSIPQAAGRDPS